MGTVSFRDPEGFIFPLDVECRGFVEQGKLVWTRPAGAETAASVLSSGDPQVEGRKAHSPVEVLEQESIWFPGYPAEWSAGMLQGAAITTLDLAQALLPCGLGLKDATRRDSSLS